MKIYYMYLNEKELLMGIGHSASARLYTRGSHSMGFCVKRSLEHSLRTQQQKKLRK